MRRICWIITIIALLGGIAPTQAADAAFRFHGYRISVSAAGYGNGGRFTTIAVDPHNRETLLIGSDVAGFFKSTDGGAHFTLKGADLQGFNMADIAFHPVSSNWVFLLTNEGLYISDDQGEHLHRKDAAIQYPERFFGSHLLVFSRYSLWAASDRQGVFQVALNPPEFTVSPVPGLKGIKINGLTLFEKHLFAATEEGVFRYDGEDWESWNAGLAADAQEIMDIGALPEKRMYMVEKRSGLHVWQGRKWKRMGMNFLKQIQYRPKGYKALAIHPQNPDIVFMGTHPQIWPFMVYRTQNGGRDWEPLSNFHLDPSASDYWGVDKTLSAVEAVTFTPQAPSHMYIADWWSVWKSTDSGVNWLQLHNGLQNTVISDIKADPHDPQTLYLALWDNGLMVTHNRGGRWDRHMKGALPGHGRELEISSQNPDKMYLIMNPWFKTDKIYIYKTLDHGETWQDVSFPIPVEPLPSLGYVDGLGTNIEIDPRSDDTVYAATNGYGVYKTTDGGKSWHPANRGLRTPYIKGPNALVIHPRNPQILYASTQAGGIYRSADAGRSWKALNSDGTFTFGLAIDSNNPDRIMAGLPKKQVMLSEDGGRSWKTVTLPGETPPYIAAYAVAFHPQNPRLVFVGTLSYEYRAADGLYMSTDGGHSFAQVPLRLPRININDILIPPTDPDSVYIGFSGSGLFRLDLKKE